MRILLLLFGVVCCSTTTLFLKASALDPMVLSAYRLLLSALLLLPLFFAKCRQHQQDFPPNQLLSPVVPALLMTLHLVSFAQGARWTEATNATLIINLGPVVMPFVLYLTAQEKISMGEIIGTLVAMVGVGVLTLSNVSLNPNGLIGDVTCFVSMLLAVSYLALGKGSRNLPSIWLYVVPLYAFAGLFALFISAFIAQPFQLHPTREYLIVLGLAVLPTAIAHSIFNDAMRHLSGQIVTIFNSFQFVFTSAFAYLLYHEVPQLFFYPAALIILAGALIVLRATPLLRFRTASAKS